MAVLDRSVFGKQLTLLFIFSSIGLGAFLATLMPFVDRELFGPNQLQSYVRPYLFIIIPNLFLTGAIFFGLAALTRRNLAGVYRECHPVDRVLDGKFDRQQFGPNGIRQVLLDPFGSQAIGLVTQYWTPAEQNAKQVAHHRSATLESCVVDFRGGNHLAGDCPAFQTELWRRAKRETVGRGPKLLGKPMAIPKSEYRNYGALHRLPGLTWLNFKETVKNVYFSVIVLAGVLFLILASTVMSSLYGTETYPITALVVELTGGSFSLFVLIIITFYSGEMVWRERDTNIHQLMDVLRRRTGYLWSPRYSP